MYKIFEELGLYCIILILVIVVVFGWLIFEMLFLCEFLIFGLKRGFLEINEIEVLLIGFDRIFLVL